MKIELVVAVTAAAGFAAPRILLSTAVVALGAAIPWMGPQRQATAMKVLRMLIQLMETVARSPFQIAAAGFAVRTGHPASNRVADKDPDDDG